MRVKYNETSGRWRKRVFRRVRWVFVGLAVPVVVGSVVAGLDHDRFWIWVSGMTLGALMAVCIALRESSPGYIENWRTGYEGERRTARVLAPLRRDGYVLLHDLPDRRTGEQERKGNIDHVVVSRGGVFLLDSKWLGGEAAIDGDVVHVQRRDDDDASYDQYELARGMRGRAVRLQEDIVQQADVRFVQPVVVFWNEFEAGLVRGHNVVFIHGDRLADWLQEQRTTMTLDMVDSVAACIKDARPSEHRGWWNRLPMLGLGGRNAPVQATGRAAGELGDAARSQTARSAAVIGADGSWFFPP
jgi:hypothetical protein